MNETPDTPNTPPAPAKFVPQLVVNNTIPPLPNTAPVINMAEKKAELKAKEAARAPKPKAKRKTPKQTLAANIEFLGGCTDKLHAAIQQMTNGQIKALSAKLLPLMAGIATLTDEVVAEFGPEVEGEA